MNERTTQSLLAAILLAQVTQIYLGFERTAQAETFKLDYCITQGRFEKPQYYLHTVPHPLEKETEEGEEES